MAVLTKKNLNSSEFSDVSTKLKGNFSRNLESPLGSSVRRDFVKRSKHVKVNSTELVLFVTQLAVMLDSGVVLSDALDVIAEQFDRGVLKTVVMDMAESVKSGENFSKALANYPKVFDSMFISVIKASEASGKMAEMLRILSGYLTFEMETRKRVKGALTYPIIMALVAVASTGTLLFFVLPRFMKIYESRGAALPKLTQILVSFSSILNDFQKLTVIVTSLICIFFMLHYWISTSSGRKFVDYLKIRMPALGTMFIDLVVTRSMRIMATMVNTGVSLLDSIDVIKNSCDNVYFKKLWSDVDEKICDGYQLSESIQICDNAKLIDPGIVQMLKAGERAGMLGDVSDKISIFYEKKLENSIKTVMSLIEPLMITILGSIIGTIAIALLLPVFKISTIVAH